MLIETMRDGKWVNPQDLTERSGGKDQIFSRSLDALWKTKTSNKMWVLYVDLNDGNSTSICENNRTGLQDLKHCADGGVYYAYNVIEKGDHLGFLSYQ